MREKSDLADAKKRNAEIKEQNIKADAAQRVANSNTNADSLKEKIAESDLFSDGKLAKVYHHPIYGYFKVPK